MDWDDLNQTHYDWPTVEETKQFKDKAKKVVLNAIDTLGDSKIDDWRTELWVFMVGI